MRWATGVSLGTTVVQVAAAVERKRNAQPLGGVRQLVCDDATHTAPRQSSVNRMRITGFIFMPLLLKD